MAALFRAVPCMFFVVKRRIIFSMFFSWMVPQWPAAQNLIEKRILPHPIRGACETGIARRRKKKEFYAAFEYFEPKKYVFFYKLRKNTIRKKSEVPA